MIRTFHPIGQGAFYTEFFNEFTAVYDCGSDKNIDLIEAEIRATFERGTRIDAVFISHLHEDHVNGLEYLLDYCKVRRLFLPLLTDEEKIQLLIHNSFYREGEQFVKNLIINPIETLSKKDTQIFFVPNVEKNKEVGELKLLNFNKLQQSGKELNQNVKLFSENIPNWRFIPFNFQESKRSELLKNELNNRNVNISNVKEFKKLWKIKHSRELIKKAYLSVSKKFNTNSLTLFSGPENGNIYPNKFQFGKCFYRSNHFRCCVVYEPGCLYFGDYEANGAKKWKELYNKYEIYWSSIGTVQIPHHGSQWNYNRMINQIKPMISIISAGYSNRYKHPHSSTIRNVIVDGGWPLIVNENTGSRVQFEIFGL